METTEAVKNSEAATGNARNFRSSPDIENFYRFINENKLRTEAEFVISAINRIVNPKRKVTRRKRAKKLQ